jgi:hypothetical protein
MNFQRVRGILSCITQVLRNIESAIETIIKAVMNDGLLFILLGSMNAYLALSFPFYGVLQPQSLTCSPVELTLASPAFFASRTNACGPSAWKRNP